MEVLILTTFVSVVIAAAGVGLFVWSVRARTFDHSDRLAILPLDDSAIVSAATPASSPALSENGSAPGLDPRSPNPVPFNGSAHVTEKPST